VNRKVGPLLTIGTGLIASGLVFLVALVLYSSSIFSAGQGQSIPGWALTEVSGALALFVGGGISSGVGGRLARRELLRRGIDSPPARAAAQAFLPRYTVSRMIRAGRLHVTDPVLPHTASATSRVLGIAPTWLTDPEDSRGSPKLRPNDGSRAAHLAGLVVAAIIVGLLVMFVVPVPSSFRATVPTSSTPAIGTWVNFTSGAQVSGSWTSSSGQPVTFLITNAAGARVFSSLAGSGRFTFVATDSSYSFLAISSVPSTVAVAGTSTGPLL
jgi:hypothetical protein